MTPSSLDYHPRAIQEARAALRWYARRSPALANRLLVELDEAARQIATAPAQWPMYLYGTRVYRLRRFPYLVVYRETAAAVRVLAIAHARRRPGYWRRRIP
jgi:plasmid stabilization system protein ParE